MSDSLCLQCQTLFTCKDYRTKFCSHSCAATFNNLRGAIGRQRRKWNKCLECGADCDDRCRYCSLGCRRQNKIDQWLAGKNFATAWGNVPTWIRSFLIDETGNCCSECGWCTIHPVTGRVPLEVDHIDGDSSNNLRDNLKVLCPNCHSLTPTFRNLNPKGRQRKKRIMN
jgi:hypothetical protein